MDQEPNLVIRPSDPRVVSVPILICHNSQHPALSAPPAGSLLMFRGPQGWVATDSGNGQIVPLTAQSWSELGGWLLKLATDGDEAGKPPDAWPDDGYGALSVLEDSGFPTPWLTVVDGGDDARRSARRIDLELNDGESMLVGRKAGKRDIRMLDRHVSREHLRLFARSDSFWVENLSKYPPRINGAPLNEATRLRHGDRIEIGASSIQFHNPLELESERPIAAPIAAAPPSADRAQKPLPPTPIIPTPLATSEPGNPAAVKVALIVAILLVGLLGAYLVILVVKGGPGP